MSSTGWNTKLSRRTLLKLAGAAALTRARRASADERLHGLRTRLAVEYGLRTPLVSAGMAFVSLTELAAAVSNAGAIGVYGVGPEPPPVVAARIAALQAQTGGAFGLDFLVARSAMGDFTTQDHIDIAASARVPIVVFHWDLPSAAWVSQLRAAGTRVWIQTGDPSVAKRAIGLGVQGIIAQGRSAGGHNRNDTLTTWRLVRELRAALPAQTWILAAGGVARGADLVRAIRAGADGAWAGTVFAAAAESYAHPDYKARLVAARGPDATTRTLRFGPEWPGQPQRVLRGGSWLDSPTHTRSAVRVTMSQPARRDFIGFRVVKRIEP